MIEPASPMKHERNLCPYSTTFSVEAVWSPLLPVEVSSHTEPSTETPTTTSLLHRWMEKKQQEGRTEWGIKDHLVGVSHDFNFHYPRNELTFESFCDLNSVYNLKMVLNTSTEGHCNNTDSQLHVASVVSSAKFWICSIDIDIDWYHKFEFFIKNCLNLTWTRGGAPIIGVLHCKSQNMTLLSPPGNAYSRVLERRLRPIVQPQIQEEQCGFCHGRGTVDKLFTLTRLLGGHGSLLIHSTRVLWTWRRFRPISPMEPCRGYCGSMGSRSSFNRSESCISILFRKSNTLTHFQWLLGSTRAVSCHRFCLWFSWTGSQGTAGGRRVSGLGTSLQTMGFCWLHHNMTSNTHWGSLLSSVRRSGCLRPWMQWKQWIAPSGSGVREFKYLRVLFTNEGKMEREIDAASAVSRCCTGPSWWGSWARRLG